MTHTRALLLPLLCALSLLTPAAAAERWDLLPTPWHHAALADVALAADGATALSASYDGTWRVWALPGGALRCTERLPPGRAREGRVADALVALSADGARGALSVEGAGVRLLDAAGCAEGRRLPGVCADVVRLAFARDGRLAIACRDRIEVWRTEGRPARTARIAPGNGVAALAWSADGATLLVATNDVDLATLALWDAATGERRRELTLDTPEAPKHPSSYLALPSGVALSPDGRLAAATAYLEVFVWDTASGKLLARFASESPQLMSDTQLVALSLDAQDRLWVQGSERLLRYDLAGVADPSWRSVEERRAATSVALSEDVGFAYGQGADAAGTRAVLGDLHGGLHVADLAAGTTRALGRLAEAPLAAVFLDDARLATGGRQGALELRRLAELGTVERTLRPWAGPVATLAVDPRRRRLAAGGSAEGPGGRAGRVSAWSLPDLAEPRSLAQRPGDEAVRVAWAPDGAALAIGWQGGAVEWCEAATGACRELGRHDDRVTAVAVAPDGRTVASTGEDARLRLWPVTGDGAPVVLARDPPVPFQAVAWRPDGTRVLTGVAFFGLPAGLLAWDPAGGPPASLTADHDVLDVTFAGPDRVLAATIGSGGLLWDVAKDRALARFGGFDGSGRTIAASPDGRHVVLVTTGQEQTFRVWRRR